MTMSDAHNPSPGGPTWSAERARMPGSAEPTTKPDATQVADAAPATVATGDDHAEAPSWTPLFRDFELIGAMISHYAAARTDALLVRARGLMIRVAISVVALLLVMTTLVGAVVLGLLGLAGGLAAVAGGRMWVGQLVVGLSVCTVVGAVGLAATKTAARRGRQQLRDKYGRRREALQQRFGIRIGGQLPE